MEMGITFEILDKNLQLLGDLEGISDGSLTIDHTNTVWGAGSVEFADRMPDINWDNVLVRPVRRVNDEEWPLGAYALAVPEQNYSRSSATMKATLADRSMFLNRARHLSPFGLDTGASIFTAIRGLIELAQLDPGPIPDSGATVRSPQVWPAGDTFLSTINDLLHSAGMQDLHTSGDGTFTYVDSTLPRNAPVVTSFRSGEAFSYVPEYTLRRDISDIPNQIVATSQGSDTLPDMVGIAQNLDPDDPLSVPNRGPFTQHEQVDKETQEELDAFAAYILALRSGVKSQFSIDHVPRPFSILQAANFYNTRLGIDSRYLIVRTDISLKGVGLQSTTLQEIPNV